MTRHHVRENPFHLLGVLPDAGRAEIEQQGQKLLAMLELGFIGAASYATPLGPATRTADDVRRALAELRDPQKRLAHELWARLGPAEGLPATASPPSRPAPWPDALAAMGWKKR